MSVNRYPANWDEIAQFTKAVYGYRCCRCYRSKVDLETHHTLYRIGWLVKPGKWASGWYLFPLCVPCHKTLHDPVCWKRGGTWQAHNTPLAIWSLRLRYRLGTILYPVLKLLRR
jgi:hypothetical protein